MTRARKKATNDKKVLRETCASRSNSDCSDSRVVVNTLSHVHPCPVDATVSQAVFQESLGSY